MLETMPENNNTMCSNLSHYHNNISFFQFQLILRFGLVVKHDLATLHGCGDSSMRDNIVNTEPKSYRTCMTIKGGIKRNKKVSTVMANLIIFLYNLHITNSKNHQKEIMRNWR